ncbi:MAG: rhomboid family intramembrane serine protease [Verrucomicrobia bacterium]|nr:rhomboid family intramembrane serine protease [Verrucomicrobiota bacterium]
MSVCAPRATYREGRSAPPGADLLVLAALIAWASLPLLAGRVPLGLVYFPELVAEGERWRILTHAFAHVSLYHLALDAGAFLMLYHQLRPLGAARRMLVAATAAAGSLAAAHLGPGIYERGLCGLSGAAHGLMAAAGLDMAFAGSGRARSAGMASLVLVAGKSLIEAATGSVFFSDFHLGSIGNPIAICHLGGVLGGAAAWTVLRFAPRKALARDGGGGTLLAK